MILGIFDWVWELMYQLTKLFFNIIELITICCNMIGGIDPVTIDGEDTTLFEYLFTTKEVYVAFAVAAVCGVIFTFLFAIIQIIINFSKDRTEETPVSIFKKSIKNIFLAMCVPAVMLAFFLLGNALVKAMYQATSVGTTSLPQFMFSIFGNDAAIARGNDASVFAGTVKWDDNYNIIETYLDMEEFDFFYSYLISGIVMWALFSTALMLIERVLSLVMLYIISPLVISSSIMDDGARFKNWRDQVLTKFFTGFGAIISINIYLMVVKLVTTDRIRFFESGFFGSQANQFMKLLFIAGGAVCLKQVQAIVGNLISAGQGDKAIAENERSGTSLMSGGFLRPLTAPFRGVRGAYNLGRDAANYGVGATVAKSLGLKSSYDYDRDFALRNKKNGNGGDGTSNSGNYNGNVPNMNSASIVNNAVGNNNTNTNSNNNTNNTNNNTAKQGKDMVNNVIANAGSLDKDKK